MNTKRNWKKKGLIYCPAGEFGWNHNTFMTPNPFLIRPDTIRLYGGMRDETGASRIGYVDVKADNPSEILQVSKKPVLDVGEPGRFDDNGVIMGDIVRVGNQLYMYYVGFQLVQKVKFLAFSGLAISNDEGETFKRYKSTPVLERTDSAPFIRAIHSVIYEDGKFKVWYSVGQKWQVIGGKPFPAYNIWYTESEDGIHFSDKDKTLCIDNQGTEYRIGRPRVYKNGDTYQMYYTRDFIERNYLAGYAESKDGKNWNRLDSQLGIEKSVSGWDSQMLCYPALVDYKDVTYMFYDGDDFGRTGVGYAESPRL